MDSLLMDLKQELHQHEYIEVWCNREKTYHNGHHGTCGAFLGYFQIDTPNTTAFYCKECKLFQVYSVDFDGIVRNSQLSTQERFTTKKQVAVIRS